MRIGCSSLTLQNYWKFAFSKQRRNRISFANPDTDAAIQMIRWAAGLGFKYIAYWIANEEHLETLQKANLQVLKQAAKQDNVDVEYLTCDFTASWFFSENQDVLAKNFRKLSQIAQTLGVKYIETVTPPVPSEVTWSESYIGAPLPKTVKLESNFSWQKHWQHYITSMRTIATVLGNTSVKLAIEPRPKEIIDNTDSLLRVFDLIESDSIGGLLDTSHQHLNKEITALSIHKLKGKLFGLQASENDGITAYHWPPGHGEIDWEEIVNALIATGYDGTISIDVTGMDVEREALEGKDYVKKVLGRQLIQVT
jgi:sugar phosphate isomerase/epimerase